MGAQARLDELLSTATLALCRLQRFGELPAIATLALCRLARKSLSPFGVPGTHQLGFP